MKILRQLRANSQGVALIEFAIVFPILLLLFVGSIETARYLLFREKLESSTSQLLNIINQSSNVNKASLDNLYAAFPDLMQPYPSQNIRIITTAIVNPASGETNCQARAIWQYPNGGSRIAPTLGGAVDTKNINLQGGDNVMTIEVFVGYTPLIDSAITRNIIGQNVTLYAYTYAHTRYGQFSLDPVTQKNVTFNNTGQAGAQCVPLSRSNVTPTGQ